MYFFSLLLNNDYMKTTFEIHKENLEALVEEFDSVTAVAKMIGCSDSQYSQWLNGSTNSGTGKPRGMRPSSARRIEKACGKPSGWMDREHLKPVVAANLESALDSLGLACETNEEIGLLTAYRLAKKVNDLRALDSYDAITEELLSRLAAERKKV
jgi:hypothetical protein